MKPFLTARWLNLVNLTYRVPAAMVEPYVPRGVTLDVDKGDSFVSFVVFEFRDTRVKGLSVPFHRDFPEANLRFYVRHGDRRGVVFIREYVPKAAIAWTARWIYNEPYRTTAMACVHKPAPGEGIRYRVGPVELDVTTEPIESVPSETTREHYFKEHHWGFGRRRNGETLVYRVDHPVWATRAITGLRRNGSFGSLYGEAWKGLDGLEPECKIFAVGSAIEVYPAQSLSIFNGGGS